MQNFIPLRSNITFNGVSNYLIRDAVFLVSLDVEINPRFYRGDNKKSGARKEKGELDASPKKTKRKEEPRV